MFGTWKEKEKESNLSCNSKQLFEANYFCKTYTIKQRVGQGIRLTIRKGEKGKTKARMQKRLRRKIRLVGLFTSQAGSGRICAQLKLAPNNSGGWKYNPNLIQMIWSDLPVQVSSVLGCIGSVSSFIIGVDIWLDPSRSGRICRDTA